jgi:starch phosphorylase
LLDRDPYFALADFAAYAECQRLAGETYLARDRWTRMSIFNTARSGKFSSDRTIREYCRDIWRVKSVPIWRLSQSDVERESARPIGPLSASPAL